MDSHGDDRISGAEVGHNLAVGTQIVMAATLEQVLPAPATKARAAILKSRLHLLSKPNDDVDD
jgi:hypothetical protein